MFYVYILKNEKNNQLYIGYSSDLKKRLTAHNSGKNKATKPFTPYKLIFYEAFVNKIDAKNREEYLKSGYGRRTINTMLKKYFEKMKPVYEAFSRGKFLASQSPDFSIKLGLIYSLNGRYLTKISFT